MKQSQEVKAVREKLKQATQELKDIIKQKRAASYRSLSNYSKDLLEQEEQKATSKQMDAIMELVDLNLPEAEAEQIVRTDTK